MTIALVMIVRDEEDNLAACLESVRGAVDEIVIVDTGSTDRTVETAGRYTGRVYRFPWRDDFAAARNYAIGKAASEWILSLDADERLDPSTGDLKSLVGNAGPKEAFLLPLYSHTACSDYTSFPVLRLFRNNGAYLYRGRIHEQVIIDRSEAVAIAEGPVIRHRASPGRERNRKRGRNLALLRQARAADPSNPFLAYYLGVEWLGLDRAEKALPYFEEACGQLSDAHILFRAPAVRNLLTCLRVLGEIQEAIRVCLAESLRYPFYADLFYDGGTLFEKQGDWGTAARWFAAALDCGRPPALFPHQNGTSGFLALWHLGHCYEKLGRMEEAKKCYEQAAGPDSAWPLADLLGLLLAREGPRSAFACVRGKFVTPGATSVAADSFFAAGEAGLALACLEEAPDLSDPGLLRRLFRYRVYGGRPLDSLALLPRIADPDLVPDEVVALILLEDYAAAKARVLALWRHRRGEARALLNLVSLCRDGSPCGRPGKMDLKAAVATLLAVLENCSRAGYGRLAEKAAAILRLTPEGCLAYAAHLRSESLATRLTLERKYGAAQGLLP